MNSSLNDYIDGEGSQWLATARSDAVCCIVALRYPLSYSPPFVGWYPAAFYSENQVPLNQSRLVSKPTGFYYNDREDYRYLPFDPVYWRQIDRQSLQFSCGKDRADAEKNGNEPGGFDALFCKTRETPEHLGYLYVDDAFKASRRRIAEYETQQQKARAAEAEAQVAGASKQRGVVCTSFGFEAGSEAHADCQMKLYMNEQNKGVVESSSNQQTAAVARQQAIQEATLKEQKRIQELEASLRMMQFGIDLMNGTTSSPTPSKTHSQTYNINGQIIRCTTTGSITTCL